MSDHTHLLLDSRVVANSRNARLTPVAVEKESQNPLLVEDRPWEVRFDNTYPNVLREPDGLWRMWYNPFIIDDVTVSTPADVKARSPYRPREDQREMGVCYAESSDGIAWTKPELGLVEFNGSTANNLVMRDMHGGGVMRDGVELDPDRRYKSLLQEGAASSPDGFHWTRIEAHGIGAVGDTHNNVIRHTTSGNLVGFTRLWDGGQRVVGRTETADFERWSPAEPIMQALPDEPHRQTYTLIPFAVHSVYVGFVMILDTETDVVDCELAWSPDTVEWHRIAPGEPIIPRGSEGSFDWGCVYAAACPVPDGGDVRLYYSGGDDTHMSWRKAAIGLARTRRDRYAGMAPVDIGESAVVETAPVACTGGALRVNADAVDGSVRVGILDSESHTIAACRPIEADVLDGAMTWSGGDLAPFVGNTVRLVFEVRDASLYGFSFA